MGCSHLNPRVRGGSLLPQTIRYKIPAPKHLVHQHFEVVPLVVVNRHPDGAVLAQQFAQELQARQHHAEPLAVLQVVVVMLKRALGVVGRVNKDALDLPAVEGQQGLQGFEVVALDEQVVCLGAAGVAVACHRLQQSVGHASGGDEGVLAVEPV